MPGPSGESRGKEWLGTLEVDESKVGRTGAQHVAIGALEGRACHHKPGPHASGMRKPRGQRLEPPGAVVIRQRNAGRHALDVARGMKVISLDKIETTRLGERGPDDAFPGAAHPHHDEAAPVHDVLCEEGSIGGQRVAGG